MSWAQDPDDSASPGGFSALDAADPIVKDTKIIAQDDLSQPDTNWMVQRNGCRLSSARWHTLKKDGEVLAGLLPRWQREKFEDGVDVSGRNLDVWWDALDAARERRKIRKIRAQRASTETSNDAAAHRESESASSATLNSPPPLQLNTTPATRPPPLQFLSSPGRPLKNNGPFLHSDDSSHSPFGEPITIDSGPEDEEIQVECRPIKQENSSSGDEAPDDGDYSDNASSDSESDESGDGDNSSDSSVPLKRIARSRPTVDSGTDSEDIPLIKRYPRRRVIDSDDDDQEDDNDRKKAAVPQRYGSTGSNASKDCSVGASRPREPSLDQILFGEDPFSQTRRGSKRPLSIGDDSPLQANPKRVSPVKNLPISMPTSEDIASQAGAKRVTVAKRALPVLPIKTTIMTSARSTASIETPRSNVFLGDWAAQQQQREKRRTSCDTPRQSIQHRFRQSSYNEPSPDPSALTMIDLKTGKPEITDKSPADSPQRLDEPPNSPLFVASSPLPILQKDPEAASKVKESREMTTSGNLPVNDSHGKKSHHKQDIARLDAPAKGAIHAAYGRRSPQVERPKSPSPEPPTMASAVDMHEMVENTHGVRFAGITCKDWQAGFCRFGETCRFEHTERPPKSLTCFFWKISSRGCKQSADKCQFAHYDTGLVARPPNNVLKLAVLDIDFATSGSPRHSISTAAGALSLVRKVSVSEAADAHQRPGSSTGLPELPHQAAVTEPISGISDTDEMLVLSGSPIEDTTMSIPNPSHPPESQIATVVRDRRAYRADHPDPRLRSPPTVENVQHATVRETGQPDTRPASQLPAEDSQHQPVMSYVEKQRLRPDDSHSKSADPVDPNIQDATALKKYLEAGDKVSKLLFLGNRNKPIQYVILKFPPERQRESRILRDWFRRQSCTVFDEIQVQPKNLVENSLVVVHSDEPFRGTLPLLSKLLESNMHTNVLSIGASTDLDEDAKSGGQSLVYKEQTLFPSGRVTFISDDVFYYYPELATDIIKRFLAGGPGSTRDGGRPKHKIGARPGVEQWLYDLWTAKYDEEGGDSIAMDQHDWRWKDAWAAICKLCPASDQTTDSLHGESYPRETSYLWSVPPSRLPSFHNAWNTDQRRSTDLLLDHFAHFACENAHRYRRFFFVYTRPDEIAAAQNSKSKKSERVEGWIKQYDHVIHIRPQEMAK